MQNKQKYRAFLQKHANSFKALGWVTKKAQIDRFQELLSDLDINGQTILDAGCGFGDLVPFLKKHSKNFTYLGVDQMNEFIQIARKNHPNYKFLSHDYFGNPMPDKFDIIIASGSINSNIANPLHYRKKAIKVMFNHAKKAVAFNMAGSFPQPQNRSSSRIYYANSLEILKYCLALTPKVIFRHHYRQKDFTVILFK